MRTLIDASLVRLVPVAGAPGEVRYALYAVIAEVARARLGGRDAAAVVQHAEHYAGRYAWRDATALRCNERLAALASADVPELQQALAFVIRTGDGDVAARLLVGLWVLAQIHDRQHLLLSEAERVSQLPMQPAQRALALTMLVAYRVSNPKPDAIATIDRAIEACRQHPELHEPLAFLLAHRGRESAHVGQPQDARRDATAAVALDRAHGVPPLRTLHLLGSTLHVLGDAEGALARFGEATRLASELGDQRSYATSLTSAIASLRAAGRFEEALSESERCSALCDALGMGASALTARLFRGVTLMRMGRYQEAVVVLTRCRDDAPLHHPRLHLAVLAALAESLCAVGGAEAASPLVEEALARAHNSDGRAQALSGLAEVALLRGRLSEAERHIAEALAIPHPSAYTALRVRAVADRIAAAR